MLATIFTLCALLGGTILVLQFLMTLTGMAGDDLGVDVPDDIDVPDDFDLDGDNHGGQSHYDSNWFFGVLSFRSVVAAIAFFGICGMIAHSAGIFNPFVELFIGLLGGVIAMFVVFWLMLGLKNLGEDGTIRIQDAIGKVGTVNVAIPPNKSAAGKIQITIQNRLVDYAAMTTGDKLQTGTSVEVVGLLGESTLEVASHSKKAEKPIAPTT